MKKNTRCILALAAVLLLLAGCSKKGSLSELGKDTTPAQENVHATEVQTEPTVPATIPEDGDPNDVTCKGSYTADQSRTTVVATVEGAQLTNEELAVWYWATVAQYQENPTENGPDFSKPLDTQVCPIDDTVRSWQQYFLKQALNSWHTSQALLLQAKNTELVYEEAYKPNPKTHADNMTGKPATEVLYGYDQFYEHNSMHQSWLDAMPETLKQLAADGQWGDLQTMASQAFGSSEKSLLQAAQAYNEAYMYLTFLGYELAATEGETQLQFQRNQEHYTAAGITENSGNKVDLRHVLLIPADDTEAAWNACVAEAKALLQEWQFGPRRSEGTFGEMAFKHSKDEGTNKTGGSYYGIGKGELPAELDAWAFDAARQIGDTEVLRSELGVHIVYFVKSTPIWQVEASEDATRQLYLDIAKAAKDKYPAEVDYASICLPETEAAVSLSSLLYPDVAHERYPEAPLYLQQDYLNTKFGGYPITSHGCGITTFSMLNSYMTDEEHTPPEMCAAHNGYGSKGGTDGMIFLYEPPNYDYYCLGRIFDVNRAKQYLADGYLVVSLQHKGHWTRGGHYLLLEKMLPDGMIQVRDSNIANYTRLKRHADDAHTWDSIIANGDGYWIFQPKQTRVGACSRCGTPDATTETMLTSGYVCHKCDKALTRREAYLWGKVW